LAAEVWAGGAVPLGLTAEVRRDGVADSSPTPSSLMVTVVSGTGVQKVDATVTLFVTLPGGGGGGSQFSSDLSEPVKSRG
jgi:hypothetical protein